MTITPLGAAAGATTTRSTTASGTTAGMFEALVQQHLTEDRGGSAASGEQVAAILEAASAPTAVRSDSLAALLAGLLVGQVAGGEGAPDAVDAVTVGPANADVAGHEEPTAGSIPAADGAGSPDQVLLVGPDMPGVPNPAGQGVPGPSATAAAGTEASPGAVDPVPGGVGLAGGPATAATPDDPTGLVAGAGQTGVPEVSAAASANAEPVRAMARPLAEASAAAGPLHGLVAVTGSDDASVASAPDAVRGTPVTDQVFGAVSRLVSRGDGTHRLMLRLHPADLGEVKVVMTVKDGVVDVTLSAGAAAREALREGSPKLRSLLELAGATTGQVVVRELSSPTAAASHQAGTSGGQPHSQAAPGGEQEGSADLGAAADGAAADAGSEERSSAGAGGGTAGPAGRTAAADDPVAAPSATRPTSRLDLDL